MSNPINKKRILIGITGSIAAYKSADLASRLTKLGAEVNAIFTEAGEKFISPLSIQSVCGKKAFTEQDLWGCEGNIVHISLAHTADLLVIAPATANTIAKLANGIADNLLTVTVLATVCPVIIAPAMDAGMYENTITQRNINLLKEREALSVTVVILCNKRRKEDADITGFMIDKQHWLVGCGLGTAVPSQEDEIYREINSQKYALGVFIPKR